MRLAAVIAGLLIGIGLLWGAGELHYQSCVDAAETSHPLPAEAPSANPFDDPLGTDGPAVRRDALQARRDAVDGCSRLPF